MKRFLVAFGVIAMVLAIGVPSSGAVDSTDVLIKALVNKGIITEDDAAGVRAEIANIRQDEESARKSYGVSAKRPIKIGGYLQERYTHSSQSGFNDTIEARRIRLTVGGDATEQIDFKVQVDFAGSRKGVAGVDFGNSKTTTAYFGKPLLLDAVIGYKLAGDNKLSVGQFKVPFSVENLTSSPYLDLISRSQIVEALVPGRDIGSQGRDIGVQYSGLKSFGKEGSRQLEYYAGLFNGSGINIADENDRKDPAVRLVLRPGIEGLALAASHYNGKLGATKLAHDRTGGELIYSRGPWTLKSEYITAKDAAVGKNGWYATLVRQVTPVLQGAVRIDKLDPNTGVADNEVRTLTAGLTRFLNKDGYSRVQLNYERKEDNATNTTVNTILGQFQAGF
jgi:phosphate-selective porin OprO and OprP